MHYIKLLRPPTISSVLGQNTVKLVLSVTTDLADAHLSPDEPLELCVLAIATARPAEPVDLTLTRAVKPTWTRGQRVLKLDLPLPASAAGPGAQAHVLQVRPHDLQYAARSSEDILAARQGLVVPVYVDLPAGQNAQPVSFRSLRLARGEPPLQVEEDVGESMARHVWDGGVAATCLVAQLCAAPPPGSPPGGISMPVLRDVLVGAAPGRERGGPLGVLELGCGTGALGIALAHILSWSGTGARIVLTDLPDARKRAESNIARFRRRPGAHAGTSVSLSYEDLDWEEASKGEDAVGSVVKGLVHLVVVSDCTYNTDTLPALVKTLSNIHSRSSRFAVTGPFLPNATKVFLGTKQRHSSERAVFDLLARDGWSVVETARVPLLHLGSEHQAFEGYLWKKA